jgi:hypothetical protein
VSTVTSSTSRRSSFEEEEQLLLATRSRPASKPVGDRDARARFEGAQLVGISVIVIWAG